jgi:hypothetical protein
MHRGNGRRHYQGRHNSPDKLSMILHIEAVKSYAIKSGAAQRTRGKTDKMMVLPSCWSPGALD